VVKEEIGEQGFTTNENGRMEGRINHPQHEEKHPFNFKTL